MLAITEAQLQPVGGSRNIRGGNEGKSGEVSDFSMDYYHNPKAPLPGSLLRQFSLLLLRWAAALSLACYRCWPESQAGWKNLWQKQAWPLASELERWGLPLPLILAYAAVVIADLSVLGLFFGALGRLSAALLLGCAAAAFLFLFSSPGGELALLYTGIFFYLTIAGPGRFSLDGLINSRQN